MDAEKMESLVRDLGFSKIRVLQKETGGDIMFCCPWHGERNPSCGISAEKEIGACFVCGQRFTVTYLVAYMKECSLIKAKDYLEERFNIHKKTVSKLKIVKRYDDTVDNEKPKRDILPNFKLAPYRSGKVWHTYLLDRGFNKQTCKDFMFGWDTTKNRVTIPIFWEDGTLSGFIGRAVLEPKIDGKDNPEYKAVYGVTDKYLVYEFSKSRILYPLHKFIISPDKEVIIVEGSLDAIWLYQLGYRNVLAILGSKISDEQVAILRKLGVKKINLFLDNDKAGFEGKAKVYELAKRDFIIYDVTYPSGMKDPAQLSFDDVSMMIKKRKPYGNFSFKRLN